MKQVSYMFRQCDFQWLKPQITAPNGNQMEKGAQRKRRELKEKMVDNNNIPFSEFLYHLLYSYNTVRFSLKEF